MNSLKQTKSFLFCAVLLGIVLSLSGCGWLPRTLEFAKPPSTDGRVESPQLAELLKTATGKKIKGVVAAPLSNFDFGIVDLIDSSARLKEGKYEVLLVLKPSFTCSLVGLEGTTLDQLVNAPEKRLALYQKGSYCGDIAPRAKLRELGLKIPQTVYVASPETALSMVANDIAALVATVSGLKWKTYLETQSKVSVEKFVETPLSTTFPGFPVLVRKTLHSKVKAKIKNGLLELSASKDHQIVFDSTWGGHEFVEPSADYADLLATLVK